jgi:hypothetical protein
MSGPMSSRSLLVYGATGRSGRLIVDEALANGTFQVVAAARDEATLAALAASRPAIEARTFPVDDPDRMARGLAGIDVVIHAAGPFHATAVPMLRACLEAGCHYADINGEIDVYRTLQAMHAQAAGRRSALVCGAGYTSAASDLLARAALATLPRARLSSVRVECGGISSLSAGSVATAMRMLALPVIVSDEHAGAADPTDWPRTLIEQPVGRLERIAEFRGPGEDGSPRRRSLVSAVSLVDTAVLRQAVEAAGFSATRVASYIELSGWQRIGYQVGALAARLAPQRVGAHSVAFDDRASPGPGPHSIVLALDSEFDEPLLRWQLDTADVYAFTARIAVAVAHALATDGRFAGAWLTPAEALCIDQGAAAGVLGRLPGCSLHRH